MSDDPHLIVHKRRSPRGPMYFIRLQRQGDLITEIWTLDRGRCQHYMTKASASRRVRSLPSLPYLKRGEHIRVEKAP